MIEIHVNLKRFDVPRSAGGVSPFADPAEWICDVMDQSVRRGLGRLPDTHVSYLLPEGLIATAAAALSRHPAGAMPNLTIGCQGVYRVDVEKGGSFGALTTHLPAAAARALGARWALIGHSEERADIEGLLLSYDPAIASDEACRERAARAVNEIVNQEARAALKAGLCVLLCMGETAKERGEGGEVDQQLRVEGILREQVRVGMNGLAGFLSAEGPARLIAAYEPRWAIGPGKTPPGSQYISFVAGFIKKAAEELHGFVPPVIYGGGLKKENAASIASIAALDGGLVALTRFAGEIGFRVEDLAEIIEEYRRARL